MVNRSSGLDFSDRNPVLDQHPDMPKYTGEQPSHLQRNKTERRRLQGLQRTLTTTSAKGPFKAKNLFQKYKLWMINEGGRQLFFGIWIFLHMLVAIFGFFHYQLKDNSENARALFGITFRAFYPFGCFQPLNLVVIQQLPVLLPLSFTSM